MSSILRTGKFLRCFANVTRNVLNTPKGNDNNLLQNSRSLTFGYSQWNQGFATQHQQSESLDPLLQRLDTEVRRFGRLSRRDLDEVLEEVRQKHAVTSSQSLLIIRCCGSLVPEELPEERTKLVEQIWKTLVDRRVPMDISHYNALLRVYIENEHEFSPSNFLKELEDKGLEPNRVTFQRLMWRHCQAGDVEGASRVLEKMRAQQLPLSDAVLDALVLGHSRLGDLEGARSVLGVMASAGLNPGPRTYALLMGGCAARGDIEAVRGYIQECRDKDIYLCDKDFMDVIEESVLGGHEEHIDFLLSQMQRSAGYNQDAVNLILKLVTRRKEIAAMKVLRSLTPVANPVADSIPLYQGSFFIRHLVKVGCPVDTVLSICQQLQDENFTPNAINIATDTALQFGKVDLALSLFKHLQEQGQPIRQHYFWPLLITSSKSNQGRKVLDVLNLMINEFKIGVSSETLREYVISNLKTSDPDKIMTLLREGGVTVNQAGKTLVQSLLIKNKLKEAAYLALKYGTRLNLNNHSKPLTAALLATKDIESFVTVVHLANQESPKRTQVVPNEDEEQESNSVQEYRDTNGRLIVMLLTKDNAFISFLPSLLESLHNKGLGISAKSAERVQEVLGDNLTPDISEGLAKLTSDDLEILSVDSPSIPAVHRSVDVLEKMLADNTQRGENALGLKKQLLMAYIRTKQGTKVDEFLQKLETENYVLTPGILAVLVELYSMEGNLEKTQVYLDQLYTKEPNFVLEDIKLIRLIQLFVNNDQFDKVKDLLKSLPNEKNSSSNMFLYNSLCWRLLNSLADKGNVDKLYELFNILNERKLLEINNAILGPLVKVHLSLDNIPKALEEFEHCCQKYRCTPWKGELTKRLIAAEDATGLQKLTDLSTTIHGEVNSLYDLVFGFVECGRLRQARRILETPGMRTRNERFNSACERYGQEGKVDFLEGLLEATRELSHIDRSEVFQQLLLSYTRTGNVDKALGLWTLLQEESVPPTDKFLIHLSDFLKSSNIEVPFVVPQPLETIALKPKKSQNTVEPKEKKTKANLSDNLNVALDAGNLKSALAIKDSASDYNFSSKQISRLLEESTIAGELDKAAEILLNSLGMGQNLDNRKVRFLLNALANKGDIATFEKLDAVLSETQKKSLSYDNRKCNAYLNAGGENIAKYLDLLDHSISTADESSLKELELSFPKGGLLGLLTNSEYIPKYMEIAEKYAKRNILVPMNLIWMHYIINGNEEQAQAIWDRSLKTSEKLFFRRILEVSREQEDIPLVDKLLQYLGMHKNVSHKMLGLVYSSKINIYVTKTQNDAGLKVLQSALESGLKLDDFNRSALIRLKKAVESSGGQFKYQIPEPSASQPNESSLD